MLARLLWPALAVCAMVVSGCGGGSGNAAAEPVAPAEPPAEVDAADFATARFSESTTVDNAWFPLRPGTRHVYEGSSVEDGERLQHRVVFTVTDLTKMVAGVEAVVVWERDYTSGELVEAELVFLAQDDGGNVWHLGQYPEEYENGRFAKTPTWIAGVRGARAGVYIRAEAREGADYSPGVRPAADQLGGPGPCVEHRHAHLRAGRVLRRRGHRLGVRDRQARRLPAQVLRARRRQRAGGLEGIEGGLPRGAGADRAAPALGRAAGRCPRGGARAGTGRLPQEPGRVRHDRPAR